MAAGVGWLEGEEEVSALHPETLLSDMKPIQPCGSVFSKLSSRGHVEGQLTSSEHLLCARHFSIPDLLSLLKQQEAHFRDGETESRST